MKPSKNAGLGDPEPRPATARARHVRLAHGSLVAVQAMPQDPLDELVLDPECRAVSANVACAPAEEPEERAGRGAHVGHPVDRRSRLGIEATVQALAESTRKGLAHHDLVLVVATCPSDGVPDASTRVASESAESVDETASQLAGERLVASDDVVAVLDVVVERAIDERDRRRARGRCRRASGRGKAFPGTSGNGRATSRSSRRKSDAAPVTVLIRRSEARSVWLLARSVQYDGASSSPSADTIAMSA